MVARSRKKKPGVASWLRGPHGEAERRAFTLEFRRLRQDCAGGLRCVAAAAGAEEEAPTRETLLGAWTARGWTFQTVSARDDAHAFERWPLQDACWDPEGAAWMMDHGGELWRQSGELWVKVPSTGEGPGTSGYADRRMHWDARHGRLVVFGGIFENATWVFEPTLRRWSELTSHPRPRHGAGAGMVNTEAGLHLFVRDELWRLDEDRWTCVGTMDRRVRPEDPDDLGLLHNHWLFALPARSALLTFLAEQTRDHFLATTPGGWRSLGLGLPAELDADAAPWRFHEADWSGRSDYLLGLDAATATLVICDEDARYTLELDGLLWPDCEVPTRPAARVNPLRQTANAPDALAMLPTDEDSPLSEQEWSLLPEEVRPPFERGNRPLLIVPYRPEMRCAKSFEALLVVESLEGPSSLLSPIEADPEGAARLAVVPLARWSRTEPVAFVEWGYATDGWSYRPLRVRFRPFRDVRAEDVYECDSAEDRAWHLGQGDKVGGHASKSWFSLEYDGATYPVSLQLQKLVHVGDGDRLTVELFDERSSPRARRTSLRGRARVLR